MGSEGPDQTDSVEQRQGGEPSPRRGPRSNAGQAAGGESDRGASGAVDEVAAVRGLPRAGRDRFPPQHVPWSIYHAFALLGFYLVVSIFLSALAEVGFPSLTDDTGPWVDAAKAGMQMGGSQALFLLVAYTFLKDRAGGGARAGRVLGLEIHQPGRAVRKAIAPIVMGTGVLLVWVAVQNVLIQKLGWKLPEQGIVERVHHTVSAGGPHELAMFVVLTVVVAPVVEEVLFRGLLYLPLRAALGPVSAALGVSLLFAFIHLPALVALVPTFLLAVLLTWLMERTRTLWAPIVGHMLFNSVGMILIVRSALEAQ